MAGPPAPYTTLTCKWQACPDTCTSLKGPYVSCRPLSGHEESRQRRGGLQRSSPREHDAVRSCDPGPGNPPNISEEQQKPPATCRNLEGDVDVGSPRAPLGLGTAPAGKQQHCATYVNGATVEITYGCFPGMLSSRPPWGDSPAQGVWGWPGPQSNADGPPPGGREKQQNKQAATATI